MSAYKKVSCSLKNKDLLTKALNQLGVKFEVHATPKQLNNSYHATTSKADITISRQDVANAGFHVYGDIGFEWNKTSGEFDVHITDDYQNKIVNKFKQAYAKVAIEEALKNSRFTIQSSNISIKTDGKVEILASKII